MIRVIAKIGLLGAVLLTSCQQTPTAISLRSLSRSTAMSIVCRNMTTGQGSDVKGCPDAYATNTDGRHTMLLVAQQKRGEIAVIDMHNRVVIDQDPTVPGTEFLPVGANPVSIVSTPGGAATFVATGEVGREAIFVLPTSCIVPPQSEQPQHDLTRWSACKLPSAPGEMVIVTDPVSDSTGQPRRSCDDPSFQDGPTQSDCPADWDAEQSVGPAGRRKILVTLPDLGRVAILDARQLANRTPGTFDACPIERVVPLATTVPAAAPIQDIPADLQASTCPLTPRYSYSQDNSPSLPAGISLKDGKLYVADLKLPLVHVLDVSDPCKPHETDPLLPTSFDEPTRKVVTSDVAVSDVTSNNEQFVYAVDKKDGSLMAFDISKSQRTPIVRSGMPYLPYEAPDRIRLSYLNTAVKDLLFVKHDVPVVSDGSLTSTTGVKCDPNPDATPPANEYRTSSDYSRGANPIKLRGIFAVAALSNGVVSVVDVDDWDARCRRPITANTTISPENSELPLVDWRGCHDDPPGAANWFHPYSFKDQSGYRTTTDEVSCNVVEPHHARSARFMGNNTSLGVFAPSLQAPPILTSLSTSASTGAAAGAGTQPQMLAVPFAGTKAGAANAYSELFVGSTHYYLPNSAQQSATEAPSGATPLSVDPSSSTQNSVLLPQIEPRSYLSNESFSVTYEGKLFADRNSGYLSTENLTLTDKDWNFCDQGIQDIDVAEQRASDFIDNAELSAKRSFATAHADTLQITSDFSDSDPYWVTPVGASCAKDTETGESGIVACRSYFGTASNFTAARDWQIVEAYTDHLVFQPIAANVIRNDTAQAVANLHCCFPGTVSYTVRASKQWLFRGQQPTHNIVVGANSRCVVEDPACHRKRYLRDRIIEISSSAPCVISGASACAIGPSTPEDSACVVDYQTAVNPTTYTNACVFDSLRARFAIYRGKSPSVRDMAFLWQVTGGFVPYQLNLANRLTGSSIMPEALIPAPNLNAVFVVDSVSGGVFELSLDPFGIVGDPYL